MTELPPPPFEWTIFGVDVFVGFAAFGALMALLLWIILAFRARPVLTGGLLHQITVYLTIGAFIAINLVLLVALTLRPEGYIVRMMVAFAMGIELTAAISATLLIRDRTRRPHRGG